LVLCSRCLWRFDENGLDTMACEFFDQQDLIGMPARASTGENSAPWQGTHNIFIERCGGA
jgi:hypothetical protein